MSSFKYKDSEGNWIKVGLGDISGLVGARISTGSYIGSGKSGSANPNTLSFDFVPKMVVITAGDGFHLEEDEHEVIQFTAPFFWISGQTTIGDIVHISQSEYSISWYASYASSQYNIQNTIYHYFAIG